ESAPVSALLVAHAREAPRRPGSLTTSPLPEALDQLVLDCLAKDPAARPGSAAALAERLVAVPLPRPWTESLASEWWEKNRPPSEPWLERQRTPVRGGA